MSKRFVVTTVLFVIVLLIVVFSVVTVNSNSKYLTRQPIGTNNRNWEDMQACIDKSPYSETIVNNIPKYKEEELLFKTNGAFDLGRDAGVYNWLNHKPNSTNIIINLYPTEAIRQKDDDHLYFMYDTDTGYRLFLFFENDAEREIDYSGIYLQGYPVLVKDIQSYKDFKNIRIGSSIDEVSKVDPVAGLHKKQFTEVWELNYEGAKNGGADKGLSCVTMHYLSDGLLKIEYEMLESGEYVVSNIIYSKDRIIPDIYDKEVDYNILDIDLPES